MLCCPSIDSRCNAVYFVYWHVRGRTSQASLGGTDKLFDLILDIFGNLEQFWLLCYPLWSYVGMLILNTYFFEYLLVCWIIQQGMSWKPYLVVWAFIHNRLGLKFFLVLPWHRIILWMSWQFIIAAIFDLDAVLEIHPYWVSAILKQSPSWNYLYWANDNLSSLVESCFIVLFPVYRKTCHDSDQRL